MLWSALSSTQNKSRNRWKCLLTWTKKSRTLPGSQGPLFTSFALMSVLTQMKLTLTLFWRATSHWWMRRWCTIRKVCVKLKVLSDTWHPMESSWTNVSCLKQCCFRLKAFRDTILTRWVRASTRNSIRIKAISWWKIHLRSRKRQQNQEGKRSER